MKNIHKQIRTRLQYRQPTRQNRTTRKCKYCGQRYTIPATPRYNATKYCSKQCRHYARMEQQTNNTRKYRHKYPQKRYETLGVGRLGEHPCKDWEQEARKIRKEKRRLGL